MVTQRDVQRRIDGSIDVEFYRDRGLAERRDVLRAFFRGLVRSPAMILRLTQRECDLHHTAPDSSRLFRMAPDPV